MNKFIPWSMILMLASYEAAAQPTFEKLYGAGSAKQNLIELASGNLFTSIAYQGGIAIYNPQGDVLYTRCYAADSLLLLQSVKRYSDNEFFFASSSYTPGQCWINGSAYPRIGPVIGRIDSLGSVLNIKQYVLNGSCQNLVRDLAVTHDKGVLTWGDEESFFVLRADSNLAHVWSKYFNHHGSFQFVKELPGGDVLAGFNMDTAGVSLARLDAAGNMLWCKSYFRPHGIVLDCLIESDSSFIITGYTDSTATDLFTPPPPDYHPQLFMLKLNGTGQVQWCKGYEAQPLWYTTSGQRIVRSLDGNYVLLGNVGGGQINVAYRPLLFKTDTNGDTLWTRTYGLTFPLGTQELLAYSDGSFLFSEGSYSYIFKTDSLGHVPCSELSHTPMTVSDLFPVDSSFTLLSIDGAQTLPAAAHDTIYPDIIVMDACPFAVAVPMAHPPKRFTVQPNPNLGQFTVSFTDPLKAESYYSVFDTMGKLLYQRPLSMGKTSEEVDLSRFAKGTYLIKFTDPSGVCFERVVVE